MVRPTVYVVEDAAALAGALARLLEDADLPVQVFDSAETFLAALRPGARGCLVLDLKLPGLGGLELQARLNEFGSDLPVIFLTGCGRVRTSVRALKAGAFDFLEKPVAPLLLLDRVRGALAESRKRHAAKVAAAQAASRVQRLTAREREVLRYVTSGRSSKEIARHLGVSHRTVEVHRAHIMEKTGSHNVVDLISIEHALRGSGTPSETLDWGKPPSTARRRNE